MNNVTIDRDSLIIICKASLLSMAKKDVRYYLNGLHVYNVGKNVIIFEATDGHRISKIALFSGPTVPDFDVIVPRFAIEEISKWKLSKGATNIALQFDDFRTGKFVTAIGSSIAVTFIDGKFPDTSTVIRNYLDSEGEVSPVCGFNPKYMMDAYKAASLFSKHKRHRVETTMKCEGTPCKIHTGAHDVVAGLSYADFYVMPTRK